MGELSDQTPSLSVPDAGWYPDRSDPTLLRWWDGQQWTDHTHETAPAAAFAEPVSVEAFGLASAVAAGWYLDPLDPTMRRWWDGQQWTAHAEPIGSAVPVASVASVTVASSANTMATLAMIFGLLSLGGPVFLPLTALGLAGIVVGIVALRRARRYESRAARRSQAIAGIIVGAAGLLLAVVLSVA